MPNAPAVNASAITAYGAMRLSFENGASSPPTIIPFSSSNFSAIASANSFASATAWIHPGLNGGAMVPGWGLTQWSLNQFIRLWVMLIPSMSSSSSPACSALSTVAMMSS